MDWNLAELLGLEGWSGAWSPVGCQALVEWSILGANTNIFINDLDDGTECSFNKFADKTKVGRLDDTPDGCAAFQRDIDML